jgi:1,4-dihydroxy-2-naphthoyl-CoA hydrolase
MNPTGSGAQQHAQRADSQDPSERTIVTASIWRRPVTVEALNESMHGTLGEVLGIVVTDVGPDHICGTMPVDRRTIQPFGLLHGGASVALAETLGSLGASLSIDLEHQICVGQEINANHVRAARKGTVTGTARPLHLGARSQVWDIRIVDDAQRLVCVARLTMAVLERRASAG